MAFELIERNTVAVQVKGTINDDAARPQPFDFVLHCQRLGVTELKQQLADGERSVRDFVQSIAQGWTGVRGAQGQALPFTEAALEQLLDMPGMEQLAFNAYLEQQGARAKN